MKRLILALIALLSVSLQAQGPIVVPVPTASWILGAQTSYLTSAATTNATLVSATPGNVYHYSLVNTTATLGYLRMYNLGAAPTCSSATGFVESIPIPASTAGAGIQRTQVAGQGFSTGIAYCLTATGASTGNTAVGTGIYVTIGFQNR